MLSLLGVAVVRAWLERTADAATEAKRGVARWWALRRDQLRRWWARLRGRPVAVNLTATDLAFGSDSASVTVTRGRANRATITDRDWLALLDDQVESLLRRLDEETAARLADRQEWDERIAAYRDEMREEILKATRQGWELIVVGLICSLIGTVLSFWA
jgi:hypothetical protein